MGQRHISTFFPDSFTREQVKKSIERAFRDSGVTDDGRFVGESGHGFKIIGYYLKRDGIVTAYPIQQDDYTGTEHKNAVVRVWRDRGLNAAALDLHDPRAAALAAFLESDVQGGDSSARDYLAWLDAVLRGESESEETRGNGFTVTIDRHDVLIENDYLEKLNSFRYSHEEFRTALEQVLLLMLGAKSESSAYRQ